MLAQNVNKFQHAPPGSPLGAPLGINTKSAHKDSRDVPVTHCKTSIFGEQSAQQIEKKISDNAKKRRFRHYLAYKQREAIFEAGLAAEFKSLCSCGGFAVPAMGRKKNGETYFTGAPGSVQVTWQSEGRLVQSWVKHCASPLLCFVDSPKIRWYRSQEVQKICKTLYEAGYCWQFWTFTAPHDLTSDPRVQVAAFQEAMRIFKRNFNRFKEKWGLRFSIRAVEMTDDAPGSGRKSGCHFHHHVVCFFDRQNLSEDSQNFTDKEVAEIWFELSQRWVDALIKVGLCSFEKKKAALSWAFRLDVPRRPQKIQDMDLQAVAEYLSKGASMEMTPGIEAKVGRGAYKGKRISHWDVMRFAFTSRPELKSRALAIMRALKGRAWLTYSRGLLDFCGLREIKDEEILKEKLGHLVCEYDDQDWYNVDRVKGQAVLNETLAIEVVAKGVDLSVLPIDPETKKLDLESNEVRIIQEIAEDFIFIVASSGCDPLTGEDLTVWPLADP